jgi:hypothetical protein
MMLSLSCFIHYITHFVPEALLPLNEDMDMKQRSWRIVWRVLTREHQENRWQVGNGIQKLMIMLTGEHLYNELRETSPSTENIRAFANSAVMTVWMTAILEHLWMKRY